MPSPLPAPRLAIAIACSALLLLSLALHPDALATNEVLIDYLNEPLPGKVARKVRSLQNRVIARFGDEEIAPAMEAAEEVVAEIEAMETPVAAQLARAYLNLATLRWMNEQLPGAIASFERAITLMELDSGVYDPGLVAPLIALARINFSLGMLDLSEEQLRRAQHITHRAQGVYTLDQGDLVRMLSEVARRKGDREGATDQQMFLLRMHEVEYGEDSPELLPVLEELSDYLERMAVCNDAIANYLRSIQADACWESAPSTSSDVLARSLGITEVPVVTQSGAFGENIDFTDSYHREAVIQNVRAVDIIEKHFGEADPRLAGPLRRLARIGMHDRTFRHRGERAAKRQADLLLNDPSADLRERAEALVVMGDLLGITNADEAAATYTGIWDMAREAPGMEPLIDEWFGTPIRLVPKPMVYPVARFPGDSEDANYFVEYTFTVDEHGRVQEMEIVDSNVPASRTRALTEHLHDELRYRPRMVDGKPVATPGMRLRQQVVSSGRAP